jgi:uncharacterized protein (TIGR03435 family)
MSDFAGVLFPLAGRRVIDETGLTGAFEIKTAFQSAIARARRAADG